MLEYYEVAELEKKWEEYDKNRKQFSFLKTGSSKFDFKFDKTIVILLVCISIAIGAIVWILTGSDEDENISMSQMNKDFSVKNIDKSAEVAMTNIKSEEISPRVEYNISKPASHNASNNQEVSRPTLSLNDIGIKSSEDAGGFTITNTYEQDSGQIQTISQNAAPQMQNQPNNIFNAIPKDEIIDFGNAPIPPKSSANIVNQGSRNTSGRIEIKTSALNLTESTLESKFYATNNIDYALTIAEQAYDRKDYETAIKWALISNEIDKNNIKSWAIFAKANYKKGRKDDAIFALENFNAKANNPEISAILTQIKSGAL